MMVIYVTYQPHKGNVWGAMINTVILTPAEIAEAIDKIKKEAEEAGVKAIFQTSDELLGELLEDIEATR